MSDRILSALLLILSLVLFGCENQPVAPANQTTMDPTECLRAGDPYGFKFKQGDVNVMTRNIYVGTDVDMVMMATTPEEVLLLSTQAFQMLLSTNFAGRAELLANEIQKTKPDLIGLQEVTLFSMQSPGDLIVGGTEPATQPFLDYLDILLNVLTSRGLDYKVAGIIEDTDVEVPVIMELDENGNPTLINDFRMTDYDVVLAKDKVKIDRVESANYQARYAIPSMGATILRGYVVVDTKIKNKHYRFVSTHLEPAVSPELLQVQMGQVMELTSILQDNSLPQIVVGDFNAEYPTSPIYDHMIDNGYIDVWTKNWKDNNPDGFTYGHVPTETFHVVFPRLSVRSAPTRLEGSYTPVGAGNIVLRVRLTTALAAAATLRAQVDGSDVTGVRDGDDLVFTASAVAETPFAWSIVSAP